MNVFRTEYGCTKENLPPAGGDKFSQYCKILSNGCTKENLPPAGGDKFSQYCKILSNGCTKENLPPAFSQYCKILSNGCTKENLPPAGGDKFSQYCKMYPSFGESCPNPSTQKWALCTTSPPCSMYCRIKKQSDRVSYLFILILSFLWFFRDHMEHNTRGGVSQYSH
jgi:hypothetical protein